MAPIPIEGSESLVIRELITRLRVSDVMCRDLITSTPTAPLREIQDTMRKSRISGVPIVNDTNHIIGLVTVDDIIKALDHGHIEESAQKHMTAEPITLAEHLPLSIGIGYFEQHHFGRFPVCNKDGVLTGIISRRDILATLLQEIRAEVDKLEELIPEDKIHSTEFFYRKFSIESRNMETAGNASGEIKKFCNRSGLNRKLTRRIGVAAFELEINIAVHSDGGSLTIVREDDHIIITSNDRGPGIIDLDKAMSEGFSTANDWVRSYGFGAGMGLPNVKRVCDEFHISSNKDHGTMVTATFFLNGDDHGNSKT